MKKSISSKLPPICFVLCSILIVACARRLNFATEKIIYKDVVIEQMRDTIIYVEIEKVVNSSISLMVDTSILENKFATSSAWVTDNLLYHNLEQKEQQLPTRIRWLDRYHYVTRDSLIKEIETVEVNKLTKIQEFKIRLGNIFGGIVLILLAYVVFHGYKMLNY